MEVKETKKYDYLRSIERIDSYLNESVEYDDSKAIPVRNSLTFNNGYYVDCYAIFVDIRESSQLPQKHQKRTLARIYRSYISELIAILQSFENCKEINIVGDCVSGIFSAATKSDVMQPFQAAYTINGILKILNLRLSSKNLCNIKVGIGLAKGNALMIQAGYKGSGVNDIVWMGDVVNHASNLCNLANKNGNEVIVVSEKVYKDLYGFNGTNNIPYQDMLNRPYGKDYYTGHITLTAITNWLDSEK